jgi:membrane protein implicated in regulation of membrane protease activity
MRGIFAGLLIALLFIVAALLVTALGAVGVALIGLLLSRWFDLSQWQGTLVALPIAAILIVLLYRLTAQTPIVTPNDDDWEDEEEDEEEELPEPPIVPWRRNRPTPGALPPMKPAAPEKKKK